MFNLLDDNNLYKTPNVLKMSRSGTTNAESYYICCSQMMPAGV